MPTARQTAHTGSVARERETEAVRRSSQERQRAARIVAERRARAVGLDRQGRRPPGDLLDDHPAVVSPARPPATTSTTTARERMLRRRRRSVLLSVLLLGVVLMGLDMLRAPDDDTPAPAAAPATGPSAAAAPAAPGAPAAPAAGVPSVIAPRTAAATKAPAKPARATGAPVHAAGSGPVMGLGGPVRRYRVAVEPATGQPVTEFAADVDRVLGDPRSWIASGQVRLQRVPRTADAEFTVLLATAASSERICGTAGLDTAGYTSCRLPGQVVINLDRWLRAVPGYGAPLATYRAYAVNHEVGHQLGHGHEACPGPGRPAPVMQQQTYGLKGCTANPWPYLDGARYRGTAVD
jgi:hypothetical protein